MRLVIVLVLALVALVLALAQPSLAAPQCAGRESVREQLHNNFSETLRGMGIAANNTMMEIYAADSGSWTIIVTMHDGVSCLVASGQAYEAVTETLPPKGVPG